MIYFAFLQTIILLVPPGVSPENFKKIAHLELEIVKINLISVSKWGNEQTDRHTRNMKLFEVLYKNPRNVSRKFEKSSASRTGDIQR